MLTCTYIYETEIKIHTYIYTEDVRNIFFIRVVDEMFFYSVVININKVGKIKCTSYPYYLKQTSWLLPLKRCITFN